MASDGAWILAAVILLGGCGGAAEEQTLCARTLTPVAADEVTRFGFSGDQLLAVVEGTHTAQLTWDAYNLDPSRVATNMTAGETTISVRIARTGGSASSIRSPEWRRLSHARTVSRRTSRSRR